ncbi:uncharacterized protein C11orf98 homolog [Saccoglossus kowalevskii]|uniref:Uncharacterized protein LOC100373673 n=1 Tax=Saccoglossus kowalevskii TaxID=10224 RepID=A0ABM0GTC0_SACKO|nr:PREDICTED: uncharacterized protein LOC100373673 [Saccoglossus kowalevskii]
MPAGGKINRPRKKSNRKQQMKQSRKNSMKKKMRNRYKQDGDIVTVDQMKRLRTNPHANVQLSGKKKRKLLKGLMRTQKDRDSMDVDFVSPKPKTTTPKSEKSSADKDVEMSENNS